MKKICALCCVVIMLVCLAPSVSAISEGQKNAIVNRCDTIIDSLKKVQRDDSRTRVYLGGYYETILTQFMMALNVRLIENNESNLRLVENQNEFADVRTDFMNDFIEYQKGLESLVTMGCKDNQDKFYDKLKSVRVERNKTEQDVLKLRALLARHVELVKELKDKK